MKLLCATFGLSRQVYYAALVVAKVVRVPVAFIGSADTTGRLHHETAHPVQANTIYSLAMSEREACV